MRPDSFFHKSENPQAFFVSDITSVLSSSGVAPTGIEDFNDNYAKDNVNVSTMTTQSFMSNLVKVEDTGSTNYLSNIRYAAGATFDSIFSPYSTNFGHSGYFSSFEIPTNKSEPNSLTLNPFNPNNELSLYYAPSGSDLWTHSLAKTGAPTAAELAKFSDPSGWLDYGHNISAAVVGTGIGESGEYPYDLNFEKDFYGRKKVEVENIRSVGLRSPMVLTGWGFDVDGKPVPNEKPDEPTDTFAAGAFSDVSNWKSGPLDVRWDDERKVWAAGTSTKIFLVKTTNVSNPPHFSYEVDRSDSRSQFTRFGPDAGLKTFDKDAAIHDPEHLSYIQNADNVNGYEQLNYGGIEYPYYEAFIIRETKDETDSNTYYNIWTDDCNDCGHITNSGCGTQHGSPSKDKKILIENPLRQSLEVGDLAFTVKTGRKEKVNTGTFSGGTGAGASGQIVVDEYGEASGEILSSGSGYDLGAIAIVQGDICMDLSLTFATGSPISLSEINIGGVTTGFSPGTYPVDIISTDAIAQTEELDIHWILQAEFKSQQIVTHVECEGGLLQSCSMKIQTQGFKTCEWCGEDTTFINAF
jgi:hypothetical protein